MTYRFSRLAYLNTLPFHLADTDLSLSAESPRALARLAREGSVDAGLLPVVEAWDLESDFEPLGNFGIAVPSRAQSVLLLSQVPLNQLDGRPLGVTGQTSTSARLLKLLLAKRHDVAPDYRDGFLADDAARLVIGDDALAAPFPDFPFRHDLGEEWHAWTGRPFVFARWVARRGVPLHVKTLWAEALDQSLRAFESQKAALCLDAARRRGLSAESVRSYLEGFIYRLGPEEYRAEKLFREKCQGAPHDLVAGR